jgi:hypothetical protein
MRTGILKICISFYLLIICVGISAQLAPKDQAEIRKKAQKLLIEYQDKLNQIGKDVRSIDKTRVNVEAFVKLYVDRKTQVYNDLDPAHTLSEYYDAETYTNNIALWYPGGITVDLDFDNAQVSNVISHGEGVYSIDFIIDKRINGMYLGKTMNINVENLLFRIGFTGIGQQYQSFKIAGIRKPSQQNNDKTDSKILEVRSTPLTYDERRDIDRETRTLLNDYTNYLSLIGDTVEDIEEKILYKGSFRSLFTNNQSPVFNDILPEGMKNQYVAVSDYINLYSEAYSSEGGKVTFDTDSSDLGFITKRNDTTFVRNVQVNKYFEGNYLGRQFIKYKIRLKLLVIFYYQNSVYKNFKISKIDQVIVKKAEVVETRTYTELRKRKKSAGPDTQYAAALPIEEDKTKIRLSAGGFVGIGLINDRNLSSMTTNENAHEWEITPQLCYSGFMNYSFKITPRLGLLTGVGYSVFGTKYSLNSFNSGSDSSFTDISDALDTNKNVTFKKNITAKYDSVVTLNSVIIPIGVVYTFNPAAKIKISINPGINISIVNKATSKADGYMHYYGYYASDTVVFLKYKDWPEEGFNFYYKKSSNVDKDIKTNVNTISFVAFTKVGVLIPLSKRIDIGLSGEIQYGLTNLVKNNGVYKDIFGQTKSYEINSTKKHVFEFKPVNIFTYGIALEFIVKL